MNPGQLNAYQEKQKNKKDMFCAKCNKIYPKTNSSNCVLCGKMLIPYSGNLPKCPTCQSTNITKISGAKRTAHGVAFGLFSNTARSQFECKNCGYKW